MPRIVFLGPPGAGKGTQAALIARELGIPHLSTGELLRSAVAQRTALGAEADGYMRAGRLVPDPLVLRILRERAGHPDARPGFLLDGFPRTAAQAHALDEFAALDHVVSFEIPEALLVERLTERRHCPACGTVYNLVTQPPLRPGVCDRDGTSLTQRTDDRPDAVSTRLRVYHDQTAPLLEYYRRRGLIRSLDATGSAEEVGRRLRTILIEGADLTPPAHAAHRTRDGSSPSL